MSECKSALAIPYIECHSLPIVSMVFGKGHRIVREMTNVPEQSTTNRSRRSDGQICQRTVERTKAQPRFGWQLQGTAMEEDDEEVDDTGCVGSSTAVNSETRRCKCSLKLTQSPHKNPSDRYHLPADKVSDHIGMTHDDFELMMIFRSVRRSRISFLSRG